VHSAVEVARLPFVVAAHVDGDVARLTECPSQVGESASRIGADRAGWCGRGSGPQYRPVMWSIPMRVRSR